MRAPLDPLIDAETKVATIGSCFASELASMMGKVGIVGGMHPGGLFYSTATIRQELERLAGGWPERATEPAWPVDGGFVDPFRDYSTTHPDEATLLAERAAADAAADALFRDAKVVVATLGLIETFRNPANGNTYRQIPHPTAYPTARRGVPSPDRGGHARRPRAHSDRRARHARGDAHPHHLPGPAAHDLHRARCPGREHGVEEPDPGGRVRIRRAPSRCPVLPFLRDGRHGRAAERLLPRGRPARPPPRGQLHRLGVPAPVRRRIGPDGRRGRLVAHPDRQARRDGRPAAGAPRSRPGRRSRCRDGSLGRSVASCSRRWVAPSARPAIRRSTSSR